MAMDYTVWYSQTLKSLLKRQGGPIPRASIDQDRQQTANIVQQANRKVLTIAENRRRRQSLHAAQMRTLEMIINGASLTDILNQLCAAVDCQVAPSKTVILLLDPDGKKLWPKAGPEISPDWMRAISPLQVA